MNPQQILGIVVILMVAPVALAIGANVVFETTGSLDSTTGRTNTTTTTTESGFDNIVAHATWENVSGDNATAIWETWTGTDNFVGENVGGGESISYWYQDFVVPTYDGTTTLDIDAVWSVQENENLRTLEVGVYLERPGGDNVTVYFFDNTNTDNGTWNTVDNTLATSTINAAGTYIIYLWDNVTLTSDAAHTPTCMRWDNASVSVTTYVQGYLENAVEDVEGQTSTGFSLGSLMPLIIAAVALVTIIVVGFVGLKLGGSRKWN